MKLVQAVLFLALFGMLSVAHADGPCADAIQKNRDDQTASRNAIVQRADTDMGTNTETTKGDTGNGQASH